MRALRALALGLCLSAAMSAQSNIQVNPANGHTYIVMDQPLTLCMARAAAESYGGYLVAVNDAAEQAWLEANFSQYFSLWIGASDEQSEGTWLWDSGEPFTFSAWCPGEPNNFFLENWAEMYVFCTPGVFTWNDVSPLDRRTALIEVPLVPFVSPFTPGPGPGQANTIQASLFVNGEGCWRDRSLNGPLSVNVFPGDRLTLDWYGPADQPFQLFTAPISPSPVFVFGVGWIDIGTPPFYGDLTPVFPAILAPLFALDGAGTAQVSFSIPQSASGLQFAVQGVVIQPPGSPFPVALTAAYDILIF